MVKIKFKAATILESMIAMAIIVTCISIATIINVNVLNSDKDYLTFKAIILSNRISDSLKTEKLFIDGEEKQDGFIINRTFEKYKGIENILQMSLKIMDENNRLVLEHNELIIAQ
jgi:hypothetical protein